MADWERIHDILQGAQRTVCDGIAVAHTLATPQFIELRSLLIDVRYESEAAERQKPRGDDDVRDAPKECEAEVERLRAGYDRTGFEGQPCPGCVYDDDGKFVRHCGLHDRLDRLQALVDAAVRLAKTPGSVSYEYNAERMEYGYYLCGEWAGATYLDLLAAEAAGGK